MEVREVLRQARQDAGLSQQALASRAGTSQAAVARYETGVASPSMATLHRLLHACGVEPMLTTRPLAASLDLSGEIAQDLRRARGTILRQMREAGVRRPRVFGSVVRGTAGPDSDIDLLVDFDVRAHGLLPLTHLAEQVSALLHRPVDLVTPELLRPEIRDQVLAEAVPL